MALLFHPLGTADGGIRAELGSADAAGAPLLPDAPPLFGGAFPRALVGPLLQSRT